MGIAEAIIGGAVISGASSIIGGNKAAKSQEKAAGMSIDEQRRQYDQTRADYAGYRESGNLAQKRQNYLLGLGDPYAYGPGVGLRAPTREQFTTTTTTAGTPGTPGTPAYQLPYNPYNPNNGIQNDYGMGRGTAAGAPTTTTKFDENAFNQAMDAYNQSKAAIAPDGEYGSLMKNFTGQDLENEPGYQFQKTQGQNALNQAAIARGGFLSGNAMKELSRYNTDYAGTKYGEAFNRDLANKNRQYNFLAGPINSGMGAAQGTAAAGASAANQITGQYGAMGNAQAANYMNMGNQIGNLANSVGTGMIVGNYLNNSGGTGNLFQTRPDYNTMPGPR